jgi:iron complex transport system ATP-binding protein
MLLDVRNASFSYEKTRPIFNDISFALEEGDVFCILGPNGIGKSTLIRCLARLLPLSSGTILFDGHDISRMNRRATAKNIGFIPQIHTPAFSYSVFDFVLMGRSPYISLFSLPKEEDITIAEAALSTVGITTLKDKIYTQISGGEQQLVLFARVLAQEPRLLLLDEPTSHLDLANQMYILELIDRLAGKGLTTIMTTHIPDHACRLAHRAAIMKDRKFLVAGEVSDVITEENLQKAYGIPVKMVSVEGTGQKVCVPLKKQRKLL